MLSVQQMNIGVDQQTKAYTCTGTDRIRWTLAYLRHFPINTCLPVEVLWSITSYHSYGYILQIVHLQLFKETQKFRNMLLLNQNDIFSWILKQEWGGNKWLDSYLGRTERDRGWMLTITNFAIALNLLTKLLSLQIRGIPGAFRILRKIQGENETCTCISVQDENLINHTWLRMLLR